MAIEATIGHHDAAEHGRRRVIARAPLVEVVVGATCEIAPIVAERAIILTGTAICTGVILTAFDGHVLGIREVPHNRTCSFDIGFPNVLVTLQIVAIADLLIAPPEAPASVELHIATGHIDDDGGALRDFGELEIDATVGIIGQLIVGDVEDLQIGGAITFERNQLLTFVVIRILEVE